MIDFFSNFIASIVTIPVLGFIAVFIVSKLIFKNRRKAFHMAIDWSTFILILAVHHLIVVIWNHSYLWLLLLLMILVAVCFVIAHWKIKHEIVFLPIFKGIWRMNFLLFFTAYLFLVVIGLFQRLTNL
jgi:hypothetical protein